jgi:cation diffusion facilitator CzcD-associated flavoprotein CzcO
MKSVDVAIVGAGFGGIGLGARLRQAGFDSLAILERDDGPGGTWRANTYPGIACDIPSHLYSFSFSPNREWSRRYPGQSEILSYLERIVDEQGLRESLRSGTEVESARYDEGARRWRLETSAGDTVEARVLVAACGQLSNPYMPAFPGLDDFEGASWHSARWNHDFDPRGKRVAVIGTGATSIQIVPELAGVAQRVDVFQRSAPWVVPRKDRAYTRIERELLARSEVARRIYRGKIFWKQEGFILGFNPRSPIAKMLTNWSADHLEEQVPDPELRAKLTPDYPIGCKRVLISDDYYPALQQPGVELVTEPIDRFVPEGIGLGDGSVRELDAVVFATGFASQELVAPMRVERGDGRTLDDLWAGGPRAHLGMTVAGMPNFFLIYGPNTNLGHNSIVFMLECQFSYIVQCLEELRRRGLETLEVRPEAMESFDARVQDKLRGSIWAGGCTNWYKADDGRIVNNWSGAASRYWWVTRRPRLSDFAAA